MICLKCQIQISDQPMHGLHVPCFLEWFRLDAPEDFKDLDPKTQTTRSAPEMTKKKDTFFHGRYLKYSARLGTTEYILKIQEDEYPELPYIEYICNLIAKELGLDIPEFYVISFGGKPTFVSRNFMQGHVGTLQHIYKYLPPGEDNHNCTEIAQTILKQTGKPADVAKFIELCLFDALIGNNDRHGRNLGFIETAKGKRLSPTYDNPSFLGTEKEFLLGAHFNPSGSIWTACSKEPKVRNYIDEFKRMGHEKVVVTFCNKVTTRMHKIVSCVDQAPISHKRKVSFLNFLEQRCKEFENAQN